MAQDAPGRPDISRAREPRRGARVVPAPSSPTGVESPGGAVPERPARAPGQVPGRLTRVPSVAAVVLGVASAFSAITAVIPGVRQALAPVQNTLDLLLINSSPNLTTAAFYGVLAAAAARRKRVGWFTLVVLGGLELLGGVVVVAAVWFGPPDALDPETLAVMPARPLATLLVTVQAVAYVLLVAARRYFPTRVRRRAGVRALVVLVAGLAVATALGLVLVTLVPGTLAGFGDRLVWTLSETTGTQFATDIPGLGAAPGWVALVLDLLGLAALLTALRVLTWSQRASSFLTPEAEGRVRELLATYGDADSLGYFATRRDKAAIFAPSGKAVVTYRVVFGVSLASGDPIGDPDHWGPAIERWLDEARTYAWFTAVMGASTAGAVAYRRAGLKVLEIGDEAVLHTSRFDLDDPELRGVRQGVQRLRRAGYGVTIRRHGDLSAEERRELVALADGWRHGETERGFSMALSRLGDPADDACVAVQAVGPDGVPVALLSFVPWGSRGLSLDLMRRDRNAANGLTELMITELAQRGPALGVDRISLNFAVFRAAFEDGARIGAGPVARGWRGLLLVASRWWQLESLYRSNAKYRPEWVPRYLCFAERRELVRISMASAIAEGFLTLPGSSRRLAAPERTTRGEAAPSADPPHPVLEPDPGSESAPASDDPAALAVEAHLAGLPEQVRGRWATRERLRAERVDPYPVSYPRTACLADVAAVHAGLEPGGGSGQVVAVTGRVLGVRHHGGVCFVTLRDWSGDLQLLLERDGLGAASLARFARDVDLGDHLGVTGEVVASRRGELSIAAQTWAVTSKCLRPLPDKHRGLVDPEARVRQRYLDLALRPEAREVLTARSRAVTSLRTSLVGRGFLEVETPQLQPVHGGAAARPFVTHMAALDMPVYLRIAPELYLKRLCVGGVERVFEIGRTFRNEGLSFKHNPEFTMLEAYLAYADYRDMLELTRSLIVEAAMAAFGEPVARRRRDDGSVLEVDLSGAWPVLTVAEAVSRALGDEIGADTTREELVRLCGRADVPVDPRWSRGAVLLEMYERLVEHETVEPAFYLDFPTDVSPLTRPHRDDPRLAERWDLVAFGVEIATAYSELVDPVEQRLRLTRQSILAAGGDPEAMQLDEDFLTALEYGMPPTGGMGMGVDRLVMMLTGRTIRETLAFPTARPR